MKSVWYARSKQKVIQNTVRWILVQLKIVRKTHLWGVHWNNHLSKDSRYWIWNYKLDKTPSNIRLEGLRMPEPSLTRTVLDLVNLELLLIWMELSGMKQKEVKHCRVKPDCFYQQIYNRFTLTKYHLEREKFYGNFNGLFNNWAWEWVDIALVSANYGYWLLSENLSSMITNLFQGRWHRSSWPEAKNFFKQEKEKQEKKEKEEKCWGSKSKCHFR